MINHIILQYKELKTLGANRESVTVEYSNELFIEFYGQTAVNINNVESFFCIFIRVEDEGIRSETFHP